MPIESKKFSLIKVYFGSKFFDGTLLQFRIKIVKIVSNPFNLSPSLFGKWSMLSVVNY